jgi:hypothetical protein
VLFKVRAYWIPVPMPPSQCQGWDLATLNILPSAFFELPCPNTIQSSARAAAD